MSPVHTQQTPKTGTIYRIYSIAPTVPNPSAYTKIYIVERSLATKLPNIYQNVGEDVEINARRRKNM